MATRVEYNGVVLHNVLTRLISQEVMYDASDTDKIGTRFVLEFNGVIHSQRVPGGSLTDAVVYSNAPGVSVTSATQAHLVYDRLKNLLSEPRKTLKVIVGRTSSSSGSTLLQVQPMSVSPDQNADIDNGPKPQNLDITSITGNTLFRVVWRVECVTGLCSPGQERVVLNNRWSIAESMDANFFTTRRIEGQLRVAHGLFEPGDPKGIPGHVHKYLIIPPLETGFKRESVDFSVAANGLECNYSVIDRQVHTAAPWPATKIEAQHRESTSDGVKFIAQIHVRLEGPPHVDKKLLMERAVDVAENRLNFVEGSVGEANPLLEYSEIVDTIGESASVELIVRVMQVREAGERFIRLTEDRFGSPLSLPNRYDPKLSPLPATYGYDPHGGERRPAVLFLLHCYLQDNCTAVHGIGDSGINREDEEIDEPIRSGTEVTEQPEHALRRINHDHYNESTRKAIYTMSKLTSQYEFIDMRVAMPVAKFASARSANDPTNIVFDLSEPQAYRKIEIDVERAGTPPEIGTPLARYADGTLIATRTRHDVKLFAPVLSPDGRQEVFRVIATTWYSLNRPPRISERLRIGIQSYAQGMTKLLPLSTIYNDDLA